MSVCRAMMFVFMILQALQVQCEVVQAIEPPATRPNFSRPSAVAVDLRGSSILVASAGQSTVVSLDRKTFEVQPAIKSTEAIIDIAAVGETSDFLAISVPSDEANPAALVQLNCGKGQSRSLPLTGRPARLSVGLQNKFAAITMTWDRSVAIVELEESVLSDNSKVTQVELQFSPKEIIAIDESRFLVADAFGGSLAIVNAASATVEASHQVQGHHIGGMAFDEASDCVLITHQQLSKIAETSYDDIHWGTLIQNLVAQIPRKALLDSTGKISAQTRHYRLGTTAHGAADPAGIVSWSDGRFAVAISGSNEVALGQLGSNDCSFTDVGAKPTKLIKLDDDQLLCINELDDTVSILEGTESLQVAKTIGMPRVAESLAEKGELDFYSSRLSHDGWMTCTSCHIDGFTPDIVSDTFGDKQFGNPKRIPSLFGASATGPWGWDGSKKTLHDQIQSTLSSTMHRDAVEQSTVSNSDVTERLIAYIATLERPTKPARISSEATEDVRLGAAIFNTRECSKCHDPDTQFTSADTYDIGITDEYGRRKFNPPSLLGVGLRRAFFHDARFKSLDEVLKNHPNADAVFSDAELRQLKAYLLSL